ncbi:MAG: hypothetical protein FWD62_10225 [Betaproteobacteria bacterium]|nr:hypothetical protein [Betaproteobacteria bacterium]
MPLISVKKIAALSAASLLTACAGNGGRSMSTPPSPSVTSSAVAPNKISADAGKRVSNTTQSDIDTADLAWITLHKIASGSAPGSEQLVDVIIDSPPQPCTQDGSYAAQLQHE